MRAAANRAVPMRQSAPMLSMPMTPIPLRRTLLALSLAISSAAAQAQAFDAVRLFSVPIGDGQGLAGLAVVAGHEYLGSDERKTLVLRI